MGIHRRTDNRRLLLGTVMCSMFRTQHPSLQMLIICIVCCWGGHTCGVLADYSLDSQSFGRKCIRSGSLEDAGPRLALSRRYIYI